MAVTVDELRAVVAEQTAVARRLLDVVEAAAPAEHEIEALVLAGIVFCERARSGAEVTREEIDAHRARTARQREIVAALRRCVAVNDAGVAS